MARDSQGKAQEVMEAFGQAVRTLRERAGLSQEEFGFRCGLDRTYISGIERGIRNPTLKVIQQLAGGLDTTVSDLFRSAEKHMDLR